MKLNGQDVSSLINTDEEYLEGNDSFELGEELTKKVLSEKGEKLDSNTSYTVDTKRAILLGKNGGDEKYIAKADKTYRGFSELGNFAEVREIYQQRIKLGKSIFLGLCVIIGLLLVTAILMLIWLEVTYGT